MKESFERVHKFTKWASIVLFILMIPPFFAFQPHVMIAPILIILCGLLGGFVFAVAWNEKYLLFKYPTSFAIRKGDVNIIILMYVAAFIYYMATNKFWGINIMLGLLSFTVTFYVMNKELKKNFIPYGRQILFEKVCNIYREKMSYGNGLNADERAVIDNWLKDKTLEEVEERNEEADSLISLKGSYATFQFLHS